MIVFCSIADVSLDGVDFSSSTDSSIETVEVFSRLFFISADAEINLALIDDFESFTLGLI